MRTTEWLASPARRTAIASLSAGAASAAEMAMMATTTIASIKVKPASRERFAVERTTAGPLIAMSAPPPSQNQNGVISATWTA